MVRAILLCRLTGGAAKREFVVCTGDKWYAERAAARLKSFEARDSVKGIVLPNAVETTGRENRLKSRGTSKALIGTQISVDNSKLQVSKGGIFFFLTYARTTIHMSQQ